MLPLEATRSIRHARILLIAGACLLGAVGYRDLVHPNLFPKRFGAVVPGEIYRSGKLTPAALAGVVEEHGIQTIVDLGAWEEGSRADRREQRTAEALGVDRIRLDLVGDATGDPNAYLKALRVMTDPESQPVLVHCGAGTERTGCLVVLYRMGEQGWSMEEVYAEADQSGHDPRRNPKLREVLETWSGRVLEAYATGAASVEGTTQDAGG